MAEIIANNNEVNNNLYNKSEVDQKLEQFKNEKQLQFDYEPTKDGTLIMQVNGINYESPFYDADTMIEVMKYTSSIINIYKKNNQYGNEFYIGREDYDGHIKNNIKLDNRPILDTKYLEGSTVEKLFYSDEELKNYVSFLNELVKNLPQ